MMNFISKIINFFRVLEYNIIEAVANKRKASLFCMKDFKFTISITDKCYKTKPTSSDYSKMRFQKEELTLDEFSDIISQGYSFCHIFKDNVRRNENFIGTNFICIDVDDSKVSLIDFLAGIDYQPTIAYTTFSNGIDDLYAFRLLYFFDEVITKEMYPVLYDSICDRIGLKGTKDNCGRKIAQLMNGNSSKNVEFVNSYIIYSTSIFIDDIFLPKDSLEYISSQLIHMSSNEPSGKKIDENDREKIVSLLNQNIDKFISRFSYIEIVTESSLDYESGYCLLDDTYVSLPFRIEWNNHKAKIKKYRDGEQRRRRLFIDAILIRKINRNISFAALLYNLVLRRKYYYDNSDGELTNKVLVSIVSESLKAPDKRLDEIINTKHARFKTDKIWCTENNISRRSYSRQVAKKLKYEEIGSWYDTSKSLSENLCWAQTN